MRPTLGGWKIDPERTAIIDVDMQRCFVEGYPISARDGLSILPRINALVRAGRDAGMLIVHTRMTLRKDGSTVGVLSEYLPMPILALLEEGSATAQFHEALDIAAGDVVLDKPRYGAFHGTDLDLILRSRDIDTVVVSGIATNVCCDTTAREASQNGYRVVFLSDATAAAGMDNISPDELQRATCATLGRVFAKIATTQEVIDAV